MLSIPKLNMKIIFIFALALLHQSIAADSFQDEYSTSNRKLTKDMYRELSKTSSKNLIYSPLSAHLMMTLTRFGAKGKTADELDKGLSLPTDLEVIKKSVKDFQTNLRGEKPYTLSSVNKIYIKEGFNVKSSFKDIVENIFFADIENVDFVKREEAAKKINQYVEGKTDNLIKNLIKPDDLDDLTRLLLINTLYFKANWSSHFSAKNTKAQKFSKSLTESLQIPFMSQINYFKYGEIPELGAKVLQIPYVGDEVDLTIVLPNKLDGLSDLQKNLEKVFEPKNLTYKRVDFRFPKFKIESDLKLVPILKKLGITELFDDHKSDLSEIAPPEPRLYASDVLQKAYIEFTESGTTAAAATAVLIGIPYSSLPPPQPVPFVVDHPFIFYLSTRNFVLFAGHVVNPNIEN